MKIQKQISRILGIGIWFSLIPYTLPLTAAFSAQEPQGAVSANLEIAGEIFGIPVSINNYRFAKRVAYTFHHPQGAANLSEQEKEKYAWNSLILHYEAFQRGIEVPEEELSQQINQFLKEQNVSWTRGSDPEAYREWVQENLRSDVQFFENQIRFLLEIKEVKDQVFESLDPEVAEEELKQEFLNEQHHVGGEMVVFETKEEADAFYEKARRRKAWERIKKRGDHNVRPVSLMTLEAYMDLWSIPKEKIYAFHAMKIGKVGPPMPFGKKKWTVYRLGKKKVADLADFPKRRDYYVKQIKVRKKWDELSVWIENLWSSANLKKFVGNEE